MLKYLNEHLSFSDMPEESSDDLDESSNDGNDLLIDNSDSSQP